MGQTTSKCTPVLFRYKEEQFHEDLLITSLTFEQFVAHARRIFSIAPCDPVYIGRVDDWLSSTDFSDMVESDFDWKEIQAEIRNKTSTILIFHLSDTPLVNDAVPRADVMGIPERRDANPGGPAVFEPFMCAQHARILVNRVKDPISTLNVPVLDRSIVSQLSHDPSRTILIADRIKTYIRSAVRVIRTETRVSMRHGPAKHTEPCAIVMHYFQNLGYHIEWYHNHFVSGTTINDDATHMNDDCGYLIKWNESNDIPPTPENQPSEVPAAPAPIPSPPPYPHPMQVRVPAIQSLGYIQE